MNASFSRWIIGMISVALLDSAVAAQSCEIAVGKFVSIEGAIELEHAAQGERQPATLESTLCQDDMIHVGENSRAAVSLINDVVLRLDQNTTMRLVDVAPQPEKRSLLELVVGAFKSFSRPPRTFAVNTPYINGLIEGTEFAMRVEGDSSMVTVYEGKVATANEKGKLTLKRGESALAKKGQAPRPYFMVKPSDAVQWTLHFPPLLAALGGGDQQIPADASMSVKEAFGLVSRGDTPGALTLLQHVPSSEQNANYHLYRAALFLDVGRVDEAHADINTALAQDPNAGLAYALRAIIEIARNEQQQALASAEKSVALSPSSSAAKIALSYAQQANFRLEAARDSLLSAVNTTPGDALAWARLGELWLMFGERDKALAAAHKAEALSPNMARAQTVFGFAALAENRETEAKTAFERAIGLASADPLAHFGLGLTKIKRGDLADGRREIEAAVALDSSNALLRSYLGKAYYEEKRPPLEGQQFDIAKELDPADPTPYLYSAIDKQTTNRPVEAMHDMQKAIELNDNRAVYRSRQLLDADLAARSASLGRVYSDLGFQELALRQGWKSVNTDPSNFSAHRFLADSYSALPRHEIARVSELLQSQLLQPLNMTPIQPRLAESNLFLIGAGGPGGMSFNEFNPVFNRNGLTSQTSGLAGENNTFAGEEVVSGIYDKASFSLGYSKFRTDGWRTNANQDDAIGNAFFQYELTPQTSIQTEYRYRKRTNGDLELRFLPNDFRRNYEENEERHTARVGLRHAFTPNSTLLASYMYQHRNTSLQDSPIDSFVTSINDNFPDQQANSGEVQHLFHTNFVNLTSGFGYFDITAKHQQNIGFDPIFGFPPLQNIMSDNSQHANLYLYSYLNFLKNVTFTLGGSGDFFHTASATTDSRDQFNPKFGVTWNVLPNTTFRAAAFRTLKRTLITDQTLEPTQVAGFNQFYDDINATDAWRYGGAIDQKFSSTVFGGVEFSKRDLSVPFQSIDSVTGMSQISRGNADEQLGRTYLFWTPQPWIALNAEYQNERFSNDDGVAFAYKKLTTNRLVLGVKLFHQSGLSASLKGSYFDQNGDFVRRGFACCEHGEDNFWIVDAAVSYRLPKRYEFIKVGANNLFDQNFNYFDTNRGAANRNPLIIPDRVFFGSITLAFP